MKKRVLFIVTYLDTGGITKALQNFLLNYNKNEYIVDVFALSHQGIFSKSLINCELLPKNIYIHGLISRFSLLSKKEKILSFLVKVVNKFTNGYIQEFLFNKAISDIEKRNVYDTVIGFSEGIPTHFVSKFRCKNRIAWIHCDYEKYQVLTHNDEELVYKKMKHIVCVSEFTKNTFVSIYPSLANKTISIHNIVDSESICNLAKENCRISYDANYINIVSVGRIDPVKRFSVIPSVVRHLLDKNHKVRWYIVGPIAQQVEFDLLTVNINKYNVEDSVFILGEQKNPYPYIANADLFVSTSLSEACPYVVNEAKILHKPIVCTDFGSVYEFITDKQDGYISSLENLSQTIDHLLSDTLLYQKLKTEILKFEYDNTKILSKIEHLL